MSTLVDSDIDHAKLQEFQDNFGPAILQTKSGRTANVLRDPRAKFFFSAITSEGINFSNEDRGFIFRVPEDNDVFSKWNERIGAEPLLEVNNAHNEARYAMDALKKLGVAIAYAPRFADNPNGPTTPHFFARNEEMLAKANETVFEMSRASAEQIEQVKQGYASGSLTETKTGKSALDIFDKIEKRDLSIGEANSLLAYVTPMNESLVNALKEAIKNGKLTDHVVRTMVPTLSEEQINGGLPELEAGLADPKSLTFTLKDGYNVLDVAKKMADLDTQRKVRAYENIGAISDVNYDSLTATQARSLIGTGKARDLDNAYGGEIAEIDRTGWVPGGKTATRRDSMGNATSFEYDNSITGAREKSKDAIATYLSTASASQLTADGKPLPLPERGQFAGKVEMSTGFHIVLASDEGIRVLDLENTGFEKDFKAGEHVGEYVGFVSRPKGPFGISLPTATTHGEALALLDAQQFKRSDNKEAPVKFETLTAGATGKVIASRGNAFALDLGDNTIGAIAKAQTSNPDAKYGEAVTVSGLSHDAAVTAAPSQGQTATAGRGGRGARGGGK